MIQIQQTPSLSSLAGEVRPDEIDAKNTTMQNATQLISSDVLPNPQQTVLQEGDHIALRCTFARETGRIRALTEDFVYVLMDYTHERRIFATYSDGESTMELITG
jgi:hypothetical protein